MTDIENENQEDEVPEKENNLAQENGGKEDRS